MADGRARKFVIGDRFISNDPINCNLSYRLGFRRRHLTHANRSLTLVEDVVRNATQTPPKWGRHLRLTFDRVFSINAHWFCWNLLTWKVSTHNRDALSSGSNTLKAWRMRTAVLNPTSSPPPSSRVSGIRSATAERRRVAINLLQSVDLTELGKE